MTKRAFFYDPYLETIGGGEKYTFTLADYLRKKGWQIVIFNGNKNAIDKLKKRFDLDLSSAELLPLPNSIIKRRELTKNADLFFWLSDGSIPWIFSKNNILHFQVPFHGVKGKSLLNKIKFRQINYVVCNSEFTQKFIEKEFGLKTMVIYPPIDTTSLKQGKKENIILTVGRFSKLLQAKRQDVLISAFKEMVDQGLKDWKFQLAGSTDVGGLDYLNELKQSAKNYPVEFYENCSFETLKNLYSKAKIFWYAGGYEIDEEKNPEKTEHFGMTVVEAMAFGCLPLIVPKGGLKEIVEDKITGFYFNNSKELQVLTNNLISKPQKTEKMVEEMIQSSKRFDKSNFYGRFSEIIKEGR